MTDHAVQQFWKWFGANLSMFQGLEDSIVAEKIRERLLALFSGVSIEVSKSDSEESRSVLISANCDLYGMPLIKRIVGAAPQLHGWTFEALKPARGFSFEFRLEGTSIDAGKLMFRPLQSKGNEGKIGIRVFTQHVPVPQIEAEGAIALIVETGLGEEMASKIDFLDIEFSDPPPGSVPITALPDYLASCLQLRRG